MKTDLKNSAIVMTRHMLAAHACVSTEEARYYLNGVHLSAKDDTTLRLCATDGKALFLSEQNVEAVPEFLKGGKGIIVYRENLDHVLKMFDRLNGDGHVAISHNGGNRCTLTDIAGNISIRLEVVDAEFPDFTKIVDGIDFEGRQMADAEAAAFDSKYVATAQKVTKALAKGAEYTPSLTFFRGAPDAPQLVTFGEPGCILIMMPMRAADTLPASTRVMLDSQVSRTVAALKAHRTRVENDKDLAKADRDAKLREYDERIAGLLKNMGAASIEGPKEPTQDKAADKAAAAPAEPKADDKAAGDDKAKATEAPAKVDDAKPEPKDKPTLSVVKTDEKPKAEKPAAKPAQKPAAKPAPAKVSDRKPAAKKGATPTTTHKATEKAQ